MLFLTLAVSIACFAEASRSGEAEQTDAIDKTRDADQVKPNRFKIPSAMEENQLVSNPRAVEKYLSEEIDLPCFEETGTFDCDHDGNFRFTSRRIIRSEKLAEEYLKKSCGQRFQKDSFLQILINALMALITAYWPNRN